jgi:beta-lactamase regulating signal transducer with metallopeptidase domain
MNWIETLLEQPEVIALGWALIHFIWQGALVGLLLAGVLRVFRDWSTNARYGAACVAMVLLMAAPVATMAIISLSANDNAAGARLSAIAAQSASQAAPVDHEPSGTAGALTQTDLLTAARQGRRFNLSSDWVASLIPVLPWLILAWLVGVSFCSMRFACGWFYAQRLRKRGVRQMNEEWRRMLRRLCRQMRAPRPVRLLESTLVRVPMAVGWLRPVILLPIGALTGLTTRQLEAIIAHELAHIRRHDYLINYRPGEDGKLAGRGPIAPGSAGL